MCRLRERHNRLFHHDPINEISWFNPENEARWSEHYGTPVGQVCVFARVRAVVVVFAKARRPPNETCQENVYTFTANGACHYNSLHTQPLLIDGSWRILGTEGANKPLVSHARLPNPADRTVPNNERLPHLILKDP